jgi:hypothetical protein
MNDPVRERYDQLHRLSAALTAQIEAAGPRLTNSLHDGESLPQDGPSKAARAAHELRDIEQGLGELATAYRQLVAAIWRDHDGR